ncbi:MAG TPA: TIR domain-containing protein [Desulfatiglandales bacterium]|nr:TIR domain-containing protein [Desulfatiglandales bacterium]
MLSCFISAPAGVNLLKIKRILSEKGLEYIHPSEIPFSGESISEKISKLISQADLFIAVFDDDLPNGNIFFELGLAVAQKKQIIILAPPKFKIPSDLAGFLYLKIDADNIEALGFTVDQLLAAPIKRTKKRQLKKPPHVGKPAGFGVIELRNRLKSLDPKIAGYELENFVGDILKESGISIIKQSNRPDLGADFAIWSDDLSSIFGNPILIEIKRSIKSAAQVKKVTDQLLRYMNKSNSRSALVLYLEGLPSFEAQTAAQQFNIIFFQLEEFIEQLQEKSFSGIIRTRRNIIAHGGEI